MWKWLRTLLSGKPHFYIGGREHPYLLRWYLLPRNPWLNLYLHKFLRDDDDRALHDHPWWFISLMLRGSYIELTESPGGGEHTQTVRWSPSVVFRRAVHRHRVVLGRDAAGQPVPCWTLVVTGPNSRVWGFWCPKGFVPWDQFVDIHDHGNVGRGCD